MILRVHRVGGWILDDNLTKVVEYIAALAHYRWDDLDNGALEAGIPETDADLPPDTWFEYPVVGTTELTLRIARDHGAGILSVIIDGDINCTRRSLRDAAGFPLIGEPLQVGCRTLSHLFTGQTLWSDRVKGVTALAGSVHDHGGAVDAAGLDADQRAWRGVVGDAPADPCEKPKGTHGGSPDVQPRHAGKRRAADQRLLLEGRLRPELRRATNETAPIRADGGCFRR
ncbi:hypothetical protein [Amycolatopsis sp. FDAARGOS 1241]|uniref:hypothetical protein n=1 Tax=Amycolatopsis sp. FDAARGOS 1241 TaxID=2778070 RepID=UPI00195178F1|nr:hypothetical protein [Amycolatopsis sp. FDAARGOS 1241]QRP45614.1 hypothetical protein I6J71_41970 [Amycolatopsis sp. FDAARGOS 1241]